MMFYYKFETSEYEVSHLFVALPISLLLFAFTASQVWKIAYEKDPCQLMLYGYDSKITLGMTLLGAMTTVCCIISILIALHLFEKN
jgi:hypothetical protein